MIILSIRVVMLGVYKKESWNVPPAVAKTFRTSTTVVSQHVCAHAASCMLLHLKSSVCFVEALTLHGCGVVLLRFLVREYAVTMLCHMHDYHAPECSDTCQNIFKLEAGIYGSTCNILSIGAL